MRVLLAHPGTQHAFHLARELEQRHLLGEFWTGFALSEGSLAAGLVAALPGFRGLHNRIVRGIAADKLHTRPRHELHALWQLRRGGDSHRVLHERNQRFQDAIPDEALRRNDAIIAFDTSAWRLALRTQSMARPLFLDRTIAHPAHWQRSSQILAAQYPGWFPPAEPRPEMIAAAEAEEHRLAHRIVVGGAFARDTLLAEGISSAKIAVNHYGVDWDRFAASPVTVANQKRPLRFLFLGSLLARKGVPVLIEAWRALGPRRGDAELWLVGSCGALERSLIPSLPGLTVKERVPQAAVPALLAECDVFVLPSLLEGFGLVLLEALAAGLPIISTPNTGIVDLLLTPKLGTIVAAGEVEPLVAALSAYLAQPPDRAQIRHAALPLRDKFSWTAYGNRWANLLREIS